MINVTNGWYMIRVYMVPPNPKYPPYWSFPEAVYITPYEDMRYKLERIGGSFTVARWREWLSNHGVSGREL